MTFTKSLRTAARTALPEPLEAERPERAPVAEMYVCKMSRRKMKAITEEFRGHGLSASSIGTIDKVGREPGAVCLAPG